MKKVNKVIIVAIGLLVATGMVLQSCNETMVKTNQAIKKTDLNLEADLSQDFYEYANGGWMVDNPLPEDRGRFGTFDQLADEGEKQVKTLIEEISKGSHEAGTVAQKIGDFYALGMDVEKLTQEGINPLKPELDKIDAINSVKDAKDQIIYFHKMGVGSVFNMFGMADRKNSSMVAAYLWQGGLGMPDRDYYTEDNERAVQLREAYKDHLVKMFMLAGENQEDADKKAKAVYKIEDQLAHASKTRLENRDPHGTYNENTIQTLQSLTPSFDWAYYFNEMEVGDPGKIILGQPVFFEEVNKMFSEVSLDDWKTYFKWNLLNDMASYLGEDFETQNFEFYGKALSGTPEMRPRWKRVQGTVNGSLSEAIGQLYVAKYFPEEAKTRMLELVSNLKYAMGERINELEWMGEETKQKAHEKLATMRVKIGYPDKWKDYTNLEIKNDSYVQNVIRASRFAVSESLNKINKPVDKEEWHMPPQMVNAYYSPTGNEIVFPAAILQPPFFFYGC